MCKYLEIEPNFFCYQYNDGTLLDLHDGGYIDIISDKMTYNRLYSKEIEIQLPFKKIKLRYPHFIDDYIWDVDEIEFIDGRTNKYKYGIAPQLDFYLETLTNFLCSIGVNAIHDRFPNDNYAFIIEYGINRGYPIYTPVSEFVAKRWEHRSNYEDVNRYRKGHSKCLESLIKEKYIKRLKGYNEFNAFIATISQKDCFLFPKMMGTGHYYKETRYEIHQHLYQPVPIEELLKRISEGEILNYNCFEKIVYFYVNKYKSLGLKVCKKKIKQILAACRKPWSRCNLDEIHSNVELLSFIIEYESKIIIKYGSRRSKNN